MKKQTPEEAAEIFYPISKGGSMWMPSADDCNKANKQEGFIEGAKWQQEQAKAMEKEQKILLVQQLKNYTYDSQCILGNDDREAIEFVDIFDNETLKSE